MTFNPRDEHPKESAKRLRKALRAAFPGVKFRLTMSRGTAWGSYTLAWDGGPSGEEVSRIARPFEGKDFDGMTDSTIYRDVDSAIGYLHLYRHDRLTG